MNYNKFITFVNNFLNNCNTFVFCRATYRIMNLKNLSLKTNNTPIVSDIN